MTVGHLREWARKIKRDVIAVWFACRNPETPRHVRMLGWFIVAYALSPIDLIPDFIPVIGLLDEALLLPGLIWLLVKLIPEPVLIESRQQAADWLMAGHAKPRNYLAAAAVVVIWGACAWALWRLISS